MTSWRDRLADWGADLAIATVIGIFFGVIGPFGSYLNGPAWQRVGFQVGNFWVGLLLFLPLIRGLMRLKLRPAIFWTVLAVGVAIVDAPLAWMTAHVALLIWPRLARLPHPPDWYPQALFSSAPVIVGFVFLIRYRDRRRRLAHEAGETAPSRDGLLGGPPSQVLCLQMEDHYVRVHTRSGSRLVLTTMGQAMAAMNKTPGLRVHRSWWVARSAVVGMSIDGRNLRLDLANGLSAPVARSAVATVRAAGWLGKEGD